MLKSYSQRLIDSYFVYLDTTKDKVPFTLTQWIYSGWGQYYKDHNILG